MIDPGKRAKFMIANVVHENIFAAQKVEKVFSTSYKSEKCSLYLRLLKTTYLQTIPFGNLHCGTF